MYNESCTPCIVHLSIGVTKKMKIFSVAMFGERLKTIRDGKGFGGERQLRAFCREFKENASVWSQLERGSKPTLYLQTIVSLCNKFDVSPNWLIFGIEPQSLNEPSRAQELESPKSEANRLLDGSTGGKIGGAESPRKRTGKKGTLSHLPPRRDPGKGAHSE